MDNLEFFTFQTDAGFDKKVPIDQPEIMTEEELEKENFHKMAGLAVQAMPVSIMKALVQEIGRENLPVFQRAAEMAYEENVYKFNEKDFEDLKSVDVFASTVEYLAIDLLEKDHRAWDYFNKAKNLLSGHPDMSGQDLAKASSLAVQAMPVPLMHDLVHMIGRDKLPVFEKAVELAYQDGTYNVSPRPLFLQNNDKVYAFAIVAENLAFDMLHANKRGLQYFEQALELFGKGDIKETKETSLQIDAYKIKPEVLSGEEFKQVVKVGQKWNVTNDAGDVYKLKINSVGNFYVMCVWHNIFSNSGGRDGAFEYNEIVNATLTDDVVEGSLSTFADLYFNELFTVVPKKHDEKLGVLPEDQGFSKKYVFAWSSTRDLIHFKDDKWKKISFKLPKHGKQDLLTPLVGGAYALSSINGEWHLEEKKGIALYE